MRHVDAYGRITADLDDIFELLYTGGKVTDVQTEPCEEFEKFNALCEHFSHSDFILQTPEPLPHSPEEEHERRRNEWFIPDELKDVDVREFLLTLCDTEEQRARINDEMDLYEERDLLPILRTMIYLVDHFRRNKIVWGVGRGSSVASYVLYKIGVHKIDAMKYGLTIREFLKD